MSVPVFVDTNILVYADTLAEPHKREIAQDLLVELTGEETGRLSLQVLQEYFSVATRKLRLDVADARLQVERHARMKVVILDETDLLGAIDLHRRYNLVIWDALIVRAAIVSDCRRLYTEDLQHGFRVGNLEIVNPFA